MGNIEERVEKWKKKLLDLSKRNRLINFRETKRSNVSITNPEYSKLYERIVLNEEILTFPFPLKTIIDDEGEEQFTSVQEGDLTANKSINELQKTLKVLRGRAKASMEEQGINSLFLTFGIIRWKESQNSDIVLAAPLILVPVSLKIESINAPYTIELHEDEVVINPSLIFKFENDFGITIPIFDGSEDSIEDFFLSIKKIVQKNDWEVITDVHLTLLSFLKINMYKDLETSKERLISNPIIKALNGDKSEVLSIPSELQNYNHDRNTRPVDTFQVVDADSSQQDAILLSKNNSSFVLQGPPGTGKSQTITNIIAEAMSDGKKVLFVSEKAAALEVVKRRLSDAGLDDFCLTLHSYKANKKEILKQLEKTLALQKSSVRQEAIYRLSLLEKKRDKLNEYNEQLHSVCVPLNISIFEANGRLANLYEYPDVSFTIDTVANIDIERLNKYKYLINEYVKTIGKLSEDYSSNPWYNCNVAAVTHELRHDIESILPSVINKFADIIELHKMAIEKTNLEVKLSYASLEQLIELFDFCANSPHIPCEWLVADLNDLEREAINYKAIFDERIEKKDMLISKYSYSVFNINAGDTLLSISDVSNCLKESLNSNNYCDLETLVQNSTKLLTECKDLYEFISTLNYELEETKKVCGLSEAQTIDEVVQLKKLTKILSSDVKPLAKWFLTEKINEVKVLANAASNKNYLLNEDCGKIKVLFPLSIVSDNSVREFLVKHENTIDFLSVYLCKVSKKHLSFSELNVFHKNEIPLLSEISYSLADALNSASDFCARCGVSEIVTIDDLTKLVVLLENVLANPKPTEYWFDETKDSIIERLIEDYIKKFEFINTETSLLLQTYQKEILNLDTKNILSRFNLQYSNTFKYFKGSYYKDKKSVLALYKSVSIKITDNDIISVLTKVSEIKDAETWISENRRTIITLIGNLYFESYTDWDMVIKCRYTFKLVKSYFANGKIPNQLKEILISTDVEFCGKVLSSVKTVITSSNIDYLRKVFNFNNTSSKVEDIVKKIERLKYDFDEVTSDISLINSLAITSGKLFNYTIDDYENLVDSIISATECYSWFAENEVKLKDYFETYYDYNNTDWQKIIQQVSFTEEIISFYGKNKISPKLIDIICSINHDEQLSKIKFLDALIEEIDMKSISQRCQYILSITDIGIEKLSSLSALLDTISHKLGDLFDKYVAFSACCITSEIDFNTIYNDLKSLQRVQSIESQFVLEEVKLKSLYYYKIKGLSTDWQNILDSISYTKKLKTYILRYSLSSDFVSSICKKDTTINWSGAHSKQLNDMVSSVSSDFKWYLNCFDYPDQIANESIYIVLDRLTHAINNLALLEEWIDFRSVRKQCCQFGLTDFVENIEELSITANDIEGVFFKRFYRLWLDMIIPNHPAVLSFRGKSHELLIQEFDELDIEQLKIARLRVLERLMARLPNSEFTTSSLDEVGILKRELSKQKKIKPLRRLFKEIPNLLTALKPCLMMSPLSVSLYLQSEGYEFDMVIFDEASQVCTEDAVGAIMRGKQVIIAGDRNQLPPTNFFAASVSDCDFDSEDEDEFEDFGAYDSILEEASIVMPERTLKWHYRSRHEHLIAFSNAKIYNYDLITFPSSTDKMPDNGVEYIFVDNGVYDRGGKKHNLNEAKRVATLVFEHFNKYPNRSLGVVTFSEAQQQAVETALRQLRMQNGSYEHFFAEDIEIPFFIKNLENVQGDERDTIIFSLGYAKDQNGQMYMNFGPLSRNGGHRRLNVAITRAKYNVKLVGSIHPTDIRTENTNAEGVKLLRQYIEFAINGTSVLQNELYIPEYIDVESPFEESVYDFLVKNGYKVKTQVGCSGYRLDMAIEHPTINGVYILGVECDGAAYHSARTARERDRLRQTILEDIGWTIHRIWSTDWIKDQKTEGIKLLVAAKKAIVEYQLPSLTVNELKNDLTLEVKPVFESKPEYLLLEKKDVDLILEDNPYGFECEPVTSFNGLPRDSYGYLDACDCINAIVENEYPIHYELLCKRLAPLFGNEKATIKIRREVDHTLKSLKSVNRKGDYFYPLSYDAIKPKAIRNRRSIDHISHDELAEAMGSILSKSFGIDRTGLYVATARAYGFNRIGGNILNSMEAACDLLISLDKAKEIDGKIISNY